MKNTLVAMSAAGLLLTSAASRAVVVSYEGAAVPGQGLVSTRTDVTRIDFNAGAVPALYTGGSIVQGSVTNSHIAPNGDLSPYFTIGSNGNGVGVLKLPSLADYFGLHWGTSSGTNVLTFSRGGEDLFSITGALIPAHDRYVNVTAGAGEYFDTITFTSLNRAGVVLPAFESDNHAFHLVTPEPGSWAMMMVGLLAVGGLLRRRLA
jgi:hypothetical protein